MLSDLERQRERENGIRAALWVKSRERRERGGEREREREREKERGRERERKKKAWREKGREREKEARGVGEKEAEGEEEGERDTLPLSHRTKTDVILELECHTVLSAVLGSCTKREWGGRLLSRSCGSAVCTSVCQPLILGMISLSLIIILG